VVGIALREEKKTVDKITKGARIHPQADGIGAPSTAR
jgi:hypothetical protein